MKYSLAVRLKEAGWKGMVKTCYKNHECFCDKPDCVLGILGTPDLKELSDACRRPGWWLDLLYRPDNEVGMRWVARITDPVGFNPLAAGRGEEIGAYGDDQEEALVNLYILLHEKKI